MHTVHIVLTTNGDHDEVEADWSDWSELGGRWAGTLTQQFGPPPNPQPGNDDIVPFVGNQEYVGEVLRHLATAQQHNFHALQRTVTGQPATREDAAANGYFMLPQDEKDVEAITARMSERNQQTYAAFTATLELPDKPLPDDAFTAGISLFTMQQYLRMVRNEWTSDSLFYDAVAYDDNARKFFVPSQPNATWKWNTLTDIYDTGKYEQVNIDDLALHVVDYHY
jgi:hypothetical protein